uniref:X protein n=5 Tax=unclassified Sigmavirus TaxID=1802944 RepID=A0AAU7L139_9RHAB
MGVCMRVRVEMYIFTNIVIWTVIVSLSTQNPMSSYHITRSLCQAEVNEEGTLEDLQIGVRSTYRIPWSTNVWINQTIKLIYPVNETYDLTVTHFCRLETDYSFLDGLITIEETMMENAVLNGMLNQRDVESSGIIELRLLPDEDISDGEITDIVGRSKPIPLSDVEQDQNPIYKSYNITQEIGGKNIGDKHSEGYLQIISDGGLRHEVGFSTRDVTSQGEVERNYIPGRSKKYRAQAIASVSKHVSPNRKISRSHLTNWKTHSKSVAYLKTRTTLLDIAQKKLFDTFNKMFSHFVRGQIGGCNRINTINMILYCFYRHKDDVKDQQMYIELLYHFIEILDKEIKIISEHRILDEITN